MSVFDDREKAFENKFKLDEEKQFKVHARALASFGRWVAGQLGFEGADAEAYAQAIIEADFEAPGNADFIGKAKTDLAAKGIDLSEHHLENQFSTLREQAASELFPAA